MRAESYIRGGEFGVALVSTYMAAVTMVQTGLYAKARPYVSAVLGPLLSAVGVPMITEGEAALDLVVLGMVLTLSFMSWRKGNEAGFARIFTLNMLMFFPAVLDFSTFNWINLIVPYDPGVSLSAFWVFGVGLLLQATYLTLRYTARFRGISAELIARGAEDGDVDEVSWGQLVYLIELVVGTALISAGVYYGVPYVNRFMMGEVTGLPYPHVIIGLVCTLLIAAGTILYLRGERQRDAPEAVSSENEEQIPLDE